MPEELLRRSPMSRLSRPYRCPCARPGLHNQQLTPSPHSMWQNLWPASISSISSTCETEHLQLTESGAHDRACEHEQRAATHASSFCQIHDDPKLFPDGSVDLPGVLKRLTAHVTVRWQLTSALAWPLAELPQSYHSHPLAAHRARSLHR